MDLGPLLRVHRQRFAYRFGLPLACVGIMALAGALVAAIHYLPEQFDAEYRDKAHLILWIAPIVCAVLLAAWVKSRKLVVELHAHGVAIVRGDVTEAVRWDEITDVYRAVFTGPFPAGDDCKPGLQLITARGQRIAIPKTIERRSALGDAIEHEVTQRLLPQARATIAAGGEIPFGAYALSRAGISFRSAPILRAMTGSVSADQLDRHEHVPWQAISKVRRETHWIRLVRPGARFDVYVAFNAIPNVPIAIRLIEDATGVRLG